MKVVHTLKVGLFGIGLDAYWEQFVGLKEKLESYVEIVSDKIKSYEVEVVNIGLIDNAEKAMEAGHTFRQADVDIIFLYVTTYALSSTVLPVVQRAKVPVIILNLSPNSSINYLEFNNMNDRTKMTGEWLSYCHGPAHHCAVGLGHIAPKLNKLASLLGIKMIKVC